MTQAVKKRKSARPRVDYTFIPASGDSFEGRRRDRQGSFVSESTVLVFAINAVVMLLVVGWAMVNT